MVRKDRVQKYNNTLYYITIKARNALNGKDEKWAKKETPKK